MSDGRPRSMRRTGSATRSNRLTPTARMRATPLALMHGIFVGEIQALEGQVAPVGICTTGDEAPFALKLDMARQCWDEARHVEISVKLGGRGWARRSASTPRTPCCSRRPAVDPVLRLAGVNRALEGLAIDVFTRCATSATRPGSIPRVLRGLDAGRRGHPREDGLRLAPAHHRGRSKGRRQTALEFQGVVDKLFSLRRHRGDSHESPISLARRFRELAGFSNEEMDEIAGSRQALRAEVALGTNGKGGNRGADRYLMRGCAHDRHRHPRDVPRRVLRRGCDRRTSPTPAPQRLGIAARRDL